MKPDAATPDPLAKEYAPVVNPMQYQCPLCGCHFDFDPARNQGGCSSCPLGKGCGLVLCPHCRYEFPEESQVVSWFSRLLRGKKSKPSPPLWDDAPGEIALSDLGVGKAGQVTGIDTQRKARAERLSAMGLTPGSIVTVRQRFPSVVVAVGETEIALDRAVTQDIRVRPMAPEVKV